MSEIFKVANFAGRCKFKFDGADALCLGSEGVYIKNYIIFSRKIQYIAKLLVCLCFCGVLCTPLAVSGPGVRANYLCPALLSVFSVH